MAIFNRRPEPKIRGQRSYKRTPITSSYRTKTETGTPSPFKKKPAKKNYRKWVFGLADVFLIIFLLGGVIYSLLLKPTPKVNVTDTSYHTAETYSTKVAASFEELKNRNKITFDNQTVVNKIQKQFPEVERVHIVLPFFSQVPKVRLVVSPPAFKLVNGPRALIIDSQGLAVARANDLPKLDSLVSLNDQSGFESDVGEQVLSAQAVNFIKIVIAQTRAAKVPIASLSLPALAQEMNLRTTDRLYFVKFYLGGDALNQTGQFIAARKKFDQTRQHPTEYLDVRVSGKVFYK